MLILLPFFSLLGAALVISSTVRKPFEITLLPTIAVAICMLFAAGLLNLLPLVRVLLIGAGISSLCWVAIFRFKLIRSLLAPGPVVCGLLLIIFAVLNRNAELLAWDEFSHWGTITRYITMTDAFPDTAANVLLPDYPYGSALLYYALGVGSGAEERIWLFGAALLKLSAMLPLFAGIKWRDALLLPTMSVFVVSAPYVFNIFASWENLLVDLQIALVAGASVLIYAKGQSDNRTLLLVIPTLAVLPLIKDTGLIMGLVAAAIIVTDLLVRSLQERRILASSLALALAGLAAMFISRALWLIHLNAIEAGSTFEMSPGRINEKLHSADFGQTLASVVDKFLEATTSVPLGPAPLNLPHWLAILFLMGAISALLAKDRWAAAFIVLTHAIMGCAFVCYLAVLVATYLFSFSPYEAVQLAGFHRYAGTFLVMWAVISLGLLTHSAQAGWWRHVSSVIALTVFVAIAAYQIRIPVYAGLTLQSPDNPAIAARQTVRNALGDYQTIIPTGSRVFSVWNGTTGQPFYMTLYELSPRGGNRWCFGLGPKRYDGDVWSCDISPEVLVEAFSQGDEVLWSALNASSTRPEGTERVSYDYLFLGAADEAFWDRFSPMFAPASQRTGAHWFTLETQADGTKQFQSMVDERE